MKTNPQFLFHEFLTLDIVLQALVVTLLLAIGNLLLCRKRAKTGQVGAQRALPNKTRLSGNFEAKRLDHFGNEDGAVLKAYTKLMSSCAKGGQWEQAISLMREMRAKGTEPDVVCFSAAINACGKAREVKEALSLFREMRMAGLRPDLISYNALIGACSKCGFYKGAVAALEEMRNDGVQPDVITYNATISACANAGFADQAVNFLEEMQSNGLEPDVITYSAVIDACSKGKKGERALEILDDMKARGLKPNVITYNTAIGACSRARLPERALELLREMAHAGLAPTHVTYTTAIICLAKCGQFDKAVELLHVMCTRIHHGPQLVKAYDAVIAVCMERGNVDLAMQLLRELRKEGWLQDVSKYGPVIRACARRGPIDDFDVVDLDKVKSEGAAGLPPPGLAPDLPQGLQWRKWSNTNERAERGPGGSSPSGALRRGEYEKPWREA